MVKEKKSAEINFPSLEELLKAGVHFGHQSRRWHPRMAPYIFATKKGIHIFDLQKTLEALKIAAENLERIASGGGAIIFVGTKRQVSSLIEEAAKECGANYVNERWLGGTLTNFESIQVNLNKLESIKEGLSTGQYNDWTKKERLILEREATRLESLVGGIADLKGLPAAIFVVDPRREKTAVREANQKGIPVAAVVDSNCDPTPIDYVIPGNDDASRAVKIILDVVAEAVKRGYRKAKEKPGVEKELPEEEVSGTRLESLGLSRRSLNALTKAGIKTEDELKKLTQQKLLEIKGLGKRSVEEISAKME